MGRRRGEGQYLRVAPFDPPAIGGWEGAAADEAHYGRSALVLRDPPGRGFWWIVPYGCDQPRIGPFLSAVLAQRRWTNILKGKVDHHGRPIDPGG